MPLDMQQGPERGWQIEKTVKLVEEKKEIPEQERDSQKCDCEGKNEVIFATSSGMACVTANNKLFLVWTLKRNSAAEMDSPWSTKG